ncbi:MAG: lactate utilization protein [Candidatus Omnitrophica bacterium]|nr:lactate utilization protein [Candidatus Omnitrophota bacterium]MBU4473165.1 lactate utilization protein [Candidatus Omnitrophota bacterium]MCG2706452.1 lactate utilization protein [Candidatus Omnitrophota bacterium]
MDKRADNLIKNWQKRNIRGLYCDNKEQAADKALEIIPLSASVGISGSVTLNQLGIVRMLESRGNKVFNQYKAGISQDENLRLRREGAGADYYLTSANAISEKGELVFFSGYGNRIAGISYAKNVIVAAGINKITTNLDEAIKRAREYATPLNCKRLNNWNTPCLKDGICRQEICFSPEYKRMCCQILIIEAEVILDRLKVILVGENLGF